MVSRCSFCMYYYPLSKSDREFLSLVLSKITKDPSLVKGLCILAGEYKYRLIQKLIFYPNKYHNCGRFVNWPLSKTPLSILGYPSKYMPSGGCVHTKDYSSCTLCDISRKLNISLFDLEVPSIIDDENFLIHYYCLPSVSNLNVFKIKKSYKNHSIEEINYPPSFNFDNIECYPDDYSSFVDISRSSSDFVENNDEDRYDIGEAWSYYYDYDYDGDYYDFHKHLDPNT